MNRFLLGGSVVLAIIMQALDMTIANVALPHMQGEMSATPDQMSWVLTSYILASAIFTAPTGYLAARFGQKRLFLVSVVGFTIASMLCGAATSLPEIVLFRLLQGAFGAALVPLAQSTMVDAFPPDKRGAAMALFGVGVMLGPVVGPSLGGYLTEFYSWRYVFYINLPIGILAFIGIWATVPAVPRDPSRKFDAFGFAMLSLGIGSLQLMLDRASALDWFSSTEIIIEGVVAGLSIYLFAVHTATTDRPFVDLKIFKDRNLSTSLVLIFVVGIVLFSSLALMPPFLQGLMGYSVVDTGNVLAPRGVGTMLSMVVVGRLVGKVDPRILIGFGMAVTSYSLWEMSRFTVDVGVGPIVYTGLLQGVGMGFLFVPVSAIAFATLEPRLRVDGTALFSLFRNIGSSIGISTVFSMLSHGIPVHRTALVENINPYNPLLRDPAVTAMWDLSQPSGLAALNGEITRQATTMSFLDDFYVMAILVFVAIPLVFVLKPPPRPQARAAAPIQPAAAEAAH